MTNLKFKAGETVKIEARPGSVPEKLKVVISFRDPRKMRRAVEETNSLDPRKFDVEYLEGIDLRELARFEDNPVRDSHPYSIPHLPGYASGMPIYSERDGKPLRNALIGGVVMIENQLLSIAAFHFLTQQWGTNNTAISSEASSDPSNVATIKIADHASTAINQSPASKPSQAITRFSISFPICFYAPSR
jgi:hypothetical protein